MRNRRFKEIAFWGLITVYVIVIGIYSSSRLKTMRYNELTILIADSTKHSFINADDIKNILAENKIRIYGTPYDSLNTLKLEKFIRKQNNVIKNIEIYPDYLGQLTIRITQRNPIVRIVTYSHSNFYIDEDGYLMPFSPKYISRVPIVSGNIDVALNMFPSDFNAGTSPCKLKREELIHNIFNFCTLTKRDPLWRKNVEQLVIKNENEVLIIPQIGNFIINFGSFENMQEKLKYLDIMYRDVLPKVGWNKYREINLSFKNQIVCKQI